MPHFTRYTCKPEMLPSIEAVLAAHGHTIAVPPHQSPNGASAMVMTCGATSVLLAEPSTHDRAEIEVWGPAQTVTVQVLEAAPVELEKQPCDVPVPPREGNEWGDGPWLEA